jgi:hypothetical protein
MSETQQATAALFAGGDPAVQATYEQLLAVLHEIGQFTVEPKKTSLHLVRTTGFAGVHPRKRSLILNLRTAQPIQSARIAKVEQVSRNRYHNEIKLEHPEAVDEEIVGWLREAYALGA